MIHRSSQGRAHRWAALFGVFAAAAPAAATDQAAITLSAGTDQMVAGPDQILSVELRTSGYFPDVLVTLDPALQPDLAAFTAAHVGAQITVAVCGAVVSEPTLAAAIQTSQFVISLPSYGEARHLAAVLQARDCLAGSS